MLSTKKDLSSIGFQIMAGLPNYVSRSPDLLRKPRITLANHCLVLVGNLVAGTSLVR